MLYKACVAAMIVASASAKQQQQSLTFVHIGKTGGGSVSRWLKNHQVKHQGIHSHQVKSCDKKKPKKWLISVRDPISRIVSAFNWNNPKNGKNADWTWSHDRNGAWNQGQKCNEFYENFPYVNDFAEALVDKNLTIQNQARVAFIEPFKHVGMGVAWYLEHALDCILKQDYRLVHAESMKEDLEKVAEWLNIEDEHDELPTEHSAYPMKNETYLSVKGRKALEMQKEVKENYEVIKKLELSEPSIFLFYTSPFHTSSQFYELFRKDCAELSNEKTFEEGIAHWRSLFRNDSIIEMNDRIFEGSDEIDAYFSMHASTFRRIQFDVVGDNAVESSDGVLSLTLYATYTPREYLGCSSMMRWLAFFWYDSDRKIKKMKLSSSTSLTQWKAQLECDWIAQSEQIEYSFNNLMYGMYRDSDVETMVTTHYALNAKLYINDGANMGMDSGGSLIEGRENIIAWYLEWEQLGVTDVMNEIDEIDINGNDMTVRMVSIASHASGMCSQSFMWYGLYRFNGKAQIVNEQRFYHQKQLETSKLVLGNCGDLSPLPKDDL